MIIISKQSDKKIPYHDKVIKSFTRLITSIDEKLINTNPILSGSNAIKYIYAPKTICTDIDLYFSSKEDYESALAILKPKYGTPYETQNATSFNEISLQLIKKDFLSPEDLILTHDLTNVACAITKEDIFTTLDTHYSWYNQELDLQKFQVSADSSKEEILAKLSILISRIRKYQDRYQLSLSNNLKSFLHKQKDFLKANLNLSSTYSYNEIVLDYYGKPVLDNTYTSQSTLSQVHNLLNLDFLPDWSVDQSTFC